MYLQSITYIAMYTIKTHMFVHMYAMDWDADRINIYVLNSTVETGPVASPYMF